MTYMFAPGDVLYSSTLGTPYLKDTVMIFVVIGEYDNGCLKVAWWSMEDARFRETAYQIGAGWMHSHSTELIGNLVKLVSPKEWHYFCNGDF